jgi:hypothetical protein
MRQYSNTNQGATGEAKVRQQKCVTQMHVQLGRMQMPANWGVEGEAANHFWQG